MDLKLFAVVFFPTDNSIEVVPSKWLSFDNKTCPFPDIQPKGFQNLQKDCNSVPDDCWPIWEVVIKKSYDTFAKSHKKAQKLLKKDEIDSTDQENTFRSTQSVHLHGSNNTPPFGLLHNVTAEESQETGDTNLLNELTANAEAVPSVPVLQFLDPSTEAMLTEFRAFQEISIRNQVALSQEIKELKDLIHQHLVATSTPFPVQVSCIEGIKWPLTSELELAEAESLLGSLAVFEKEIKLLRRIGGSNVTKTVNNIMKFMISHGLSLILRMTKVPGKVVFGGKLSAKLIKDSVRAFYTVQAGDPSIQLKLTDEQLDSTIAKWLRDSVGRGEDGKNRRSISSNLKKNKGQNNSKSSEDFDPRDSETDGTVNNSIVMSDIVAENSASNIVHRTLN